jgi:transcriptional regulator with XRE-family HTH domain
MDALNAAKVIRRVRQRLELSQEGLSRLLNATKGAVQHWERGRNNPDLGRLLALRQLCPPGPERKALDNLIRQTQSQVAPFPDNKHPQLLTKAGSGARGARLAPAFVNENLVLLRRANHRLQRQVSKLQASLDRRGEKLRILEDLATDLQRELAKLRAGRPEKTEQAQSSTPAA